MRRYTIAQVAAAVDEIEGYGSLVQAFDGDTRLQDQPDALSCLLVVMAILDGDS